MIHRLVITLVMLLAACGAELQAVPTPTPITSNAVWKPVMQRFDNIEMVKVPAGCFQMGNAEGRRDERRVAEVCFSAPFWIDRYEVTNRQYGTPGNFQGAQRPRENLTWFEARDFCARRGARLPTEAEWEYAARGPDNLIYPWGNELDGNKLIYDAMSNNETFDVGSRPEGISWVGALDMSGNVWEWVSSLYQPYPYSASDGREDPNDATSPRVYRGGMHSYIDFAASATMRFRDVPDYRDWFIGFRCAKDDLADK